MFKQRSRDQTDPRTRFYPDFFPACKRHAETFSGSVISFAARGAPAPTARACDASVPVKDQEKTSRSHCRQEKEARVEDALHATRAVGYNALTDSYDDLVQAGVIDPTKVTRLAISSAGSIAGLLLTTQVVMVPLEDDTAAPAGAASVGSF